MFSAESLTGSATSLFWVSVGILVLTVILAAVGIFTWRSTITRKRLMLTIASRSQLLSAPESMRDELQIKYNGDTVTGDPYVTAIELANLGKTHIGSDQFDGQRPLRFSLDTRIIKLLSTEHSPSSAPAPVIRTDGTTLSLMPELITKGEIIKISLLTEGRPTEARIDFKPFGDVAVGIGDREVLESKRVRSLRVTSIVMTVIILALTGVNLVAVMNAGNQANNMARVDGCVRLAHDSLNTLSTLLILHGQATEIQKELSISSGQMESYAELETQSQAELLFVSEDYQDLATFGFLPRTASVISMTQEASKTLQEDGIPKSKQDISKIDNQLASVQAALIPPSAIPSACGSGTS